MKIGIRLVVFLLNWNKIYIYAGNLNLTNINYEVTVINRLVFDILTNLNIFIFFNLTIIIQEYFINYYYYVKSIVQFLYRVLTHTHLSYTISYTWKCARKQDFRIYLLNRLMPNWLPFEYGNSNSCVPL